MELGKIQSLEIVRKVDFGVYLGDEAQQVLLPKKQVPQEAGEGGMEAQVLFCLRTPQTSTQKLARCKEG